MSSPLPPHSPLPPQLPGAPSRRVGAILAAAMLAAGIALGSAIGPGTASSLAGPSRAAMLARVLALVALEGGANASSQLLPAEAAHSPASGSRPAPTTGIGVSKALSSASVPPVTPTNSTGSSAPPASSTSHSTAPSSNSLSPTPSAGKSPTKSGEPGERTPKALPPIAHVWLIALPSGQSFANAAAQPSSAPYLEGQLLGKGELLGSYSSLAAGQLAGAATLLSGQEAAGVTYISPPACGSAGGPASPCPSGEPAGLQAADGFLAQVVPQITATAPYREGGLIAITFVGAGEVGAPGSPSSAPSTQPSTTASPTSSSSGSPAIGYPAGSTTTTLTAAGAPVGALLLSPFLRHAGAHSTSTFDQLSPRQSLEGLLLTGKG
jgi:hypothetical protein